jgi:transposase
LIKYFKTWPKEKLQQINYFYMDMWRPYASVAKTVFPWAEIVVDKFHLVAKLNEALDDIRKKEQTRLGKSQRKKFYMSRMLLKKSGEDLTDKDHQKPSYWLMDKGYDVTEI